MNNQSLIYAITKYSVFILIFLLSWILFYNQVYSGYASDLLDHIEFINNIINGTKVIPHPLFHYIVYYVHNLFILDIKIAAILVNSLLVLSLVIIIFIILDSFILLKVSKYLNLILVLVVIYSGTLFLPGLGLSKYQYLGNGSIGIWHNVTIFMVKPFAFVSYFIFFYVIEKKNSYTNILLFISYLCSVISIIAKPSFIIIFMPMILIYFFYQIFNKNITKQLLFTLWLYFYQHFVY